MATKPVADLVPGDQMVITKRVKAAWTNTKTRVFTAVYEDDTVETWDLTGDPSVEVADA